MPNIEGILSYMGLKSPISCDKNIIWSMALTHKK